MSRPAAASRLYRHALALYPRAFRDEYGADMVQLFEDQCHDERAPRVVGRALLDLAISVPTQHLERHMNTNTAPAVTAAYAGVAVTGLVVAAVGGTNTASLVIGLVIAAVAGALAVVNVRRAAPGTTEPAASNWWKFVLAGPVLIGAVIVAAGAGVEQWFLGMAVVVTGIALFSTGVLLGIMRLLGRNPRLPVA